MRCNFYEVILDKSHIVLDGVRVLQLWVSVPLLIIIVFTVMSDLWVLASEGG